MLNRLRALFRRGTVESEMDEELRYHLERQTERLVASGVPTHHARLTASREFGNSTYIKEQMRDASGWTWLEQLGQDLRYGTRALVRTPTFTAIAVLSIALGIGTNTAIFGLLYTVLFQTLAVPHPERLANFVRLAGGERDQSFSYEEFRALRQVPGLAGITAWRDDDHIPLAIGDAHDAVNVQLLDESFFETIGVQPWRGRFFGAGDVSGAMPVAVVSAPFARRVFGSEDSAVGRTMVLRQQSVTVIGVTPPSYRDISYPGYFQVAVPVTLSPAIGLVDFRARPSASFGIVGRTTGRTATANVQAALDGAFQRCCAHPVAERLTLEGMSRGIGGGKDDIRGDFAPILYALMASGVVVLLIACANVGNLLLLRAAAREREIAVRLSLGSSRQRIVRQLLTESALLGAAGVTLGMVFAAWTTALLIRWLPDAAGQYLDIIRFRLTTPILAFVLLTGAVSVLAFGLVPALSGTRRDILPALKSGGHTATRRRAGILGRGMVAVQMALALVLVSMASLLVTTLRNLATQDIGVNPANVVGMGVETRGTAYEPGGIVPLYPRILRSVQSLPGIAEAGMATMAPLFGGRFSTVQIERADGTPDPRKAQLTGVSAGYFGAAGIRLLGGRDIAEVDVAASEPVAVVSEAVAVRRFGRTNVVGELIRLPDSPIRARRVVGVVGDVRLRGPRDGPTLSLYVPLTQVGTWPYVELLVRTADGAPDVTRTVIDDVGRSAPGVSVHNIATMREKLASWLMRELLVAGLASLFGVLALALAAMGLYGVIAYNVARRTNEIGVRMALGARAADVVALVVRHSLALVAIGMLLGAPLVYLAGKAIGSMLYGVGGHDVAMLALSVAILAAVALAATLVPAMRAARIDPLLALRHE